MASALSFGAGAAEGLDVLLNRLMSEQKMRQQEQQLEEVRRSNMAREGIARDQLSSLDRDRQAREAETAGYHKVIGDARTDANVRQETSMRPIGGIVTPEEKALETKHGIPDALYGGWQPGNMGMSTPEGEQGPTGEGMPWMGTQDQIQRAKAKPRPGGDYNDQPQQFTVRDPEVAKRLGVKPGEPVDTYVDPRTHLVSDIRTGEDITKFVSHWEKPPSPDRVLIQTGEGYMRRPDAAAKLGAGENVPLADPATVRTRKNMADTVKEHVPQAMALIEEADQKGLLGPIMGRWSDFLANRLGSTGDQDTDDLMGQLAFTMSGLRTGFANVHGGARGGGSIQMTEMWKAIYDSKFMSKDRLMGALKAEQDWLAKYGSQPKGAAPPQDPNDPLSLGLTLPKR